MPSVGSPPIRPSAQLAAWNAKLNLATSNAKSVNGRRSRSAATPSASVCTTMATADPHNSMIAKVRHRETVSRVGCRRWCGMVSGLSSTKSARMDSSQNSTGASGRKRNVPAMERSTSAAPVATMTA